MVAIKASCFDRNCCNCALAFFACTWWKDNNNDNICIQGRHYRLLVVFCFCRFTFAQLDFFNGYFLFSFTVCRKCFFKKTGISFEKLPISLVSKEMSTRFLWPSLLCSARASWEEKSEIVAEFEKKDGICALNNWRIEVVKCVVTCCWTDVFGWRQRPPACANR